MTDALPQGPKAPEQTNAQMRDAAQQAFQAHAQAAQAPLGHLRSVWRRRIEPWLVAAAVLFFVGWALHRVFG